MGKIDLSKDAAKVTGLALMILVIIIGIVISANDSSKKKSDEAVLVTNQNNNINTNSSKTANNFDLSSNDNANENTNNTETTAIGNDNINSTDPFYYSDLADSLLQSQNYPGAIAALDKAISLEANNPNFYINKAETLVKMGKKSEAISTINDALVKLPSNNLLTNELEILSLN